MSSRRRLTLALVAAVSFWSPAVPAQPVPAWPTRTVHIAVPAPAGSSLDFIARLLADKLKDRWGQSVLVDNKPGAGGSGRGRPRRRPRKWTTGSSPAIRHCATTSS